MTTKIRNIDPTGATRVLLDDTSVDAGEVIELDDELAARFLEQSDVWALASAKVPKPPKPKATRGGRPRRPKDAASGGTTATGDTADASTTNEADPAETEEA